LNEGFEENEQAEHDLEKMEKEHDIYMALEKFRKIPLGEDSSKQELVFLVGQSGCGKTSFYKNYFGLNEKYKRMTKGTTDGNTAQAKNYAKKILMNKTDRLSLVIDNCGLLPKHRKPFIELAIKCRVKQIRCLYFTTDKK